MKKIAILLSFLFLSLISGFSQTAGFIVDDDEGCGTLVVHFTNTSTYQGDVTFNWNFGNGSQSQEQDPNISYTNPGTYTITLVVTDDNGTSSFSDQIVVHPFPTANFNSPSHSGCEPLTVNFNDLSQMADASLVSWEWNFGDGTVSSSQNPNHVYTHYGEYTVILEVEDAFGCENHITFEDYVQVSQPPIPLFTADPSQFCEPVNVQFTNNSTTVAPPYTSHWDFGDGGTSTQQNPTHFFQAGVHTVHLDVTDAYGCSAEISSNVSITSLNPEIEISQTTICQGQSITFTNTDMAYSQWNFGDGTSTQGSYTVNHTFFNAGQYTITLVSGSGNCTAQTSETIIVIPKPEASMSYQDSICEPTNITVTNTSATSNTQWIIYESFISSSQYVTGGQNDQISFYASSIDDYIIQMIVTDENGCSNFLQEELTTLFVQSFSIGSTQSSGCIPYTTDLTAQFIGEDPAISYEWFYEGQSVSTDLLINNFEVNAVGEYHFDLNATTEHGCTVTTSIDIIAGDILDVDFILLEDTICINDEIHATDLTETGVDDIDFDWTLGSENMPSDSVISHEVISTIGENTLTHIVDYNGCISQKDIAIYIKGPYIKFLTDSFSCENLLNRYFSAEVFDYQSLTWDFGDGTVETNTNTEMIHEYINNGSYVLSLTASNDTTGCEDYVYETVISINNPIFEATVTEVTCENAVVSIVQDYLISQVYLDFDGNTVQSTWYSAPFLNPNYVWDYDFNSPGMHNVRIITRDAYGCQDTTDYEVFVPDAQPEIISNNYEVCLGDEVHLNYTGTSDLAISHIVWYVSTQTPINTVEQTELTVQMNEAGSVPIRIKVIDDIGCEYFSDYIYINVHEILTQVTLQDPTLCLGDPFVINISGTTPGTQTTFNYGDGSAVSPFPTHIYSDTGLYNVNVHIIDNIGCQQDYTFTGISVQNAVADIELLEDTLHCNPETPDFTRPTSELPAYYQYEWSDDIGHLSFVPFPIFVYPERGEYHIQYSVTTPNGCSDSKALTLYIDSPDADIILSDDIICINDTIAFYMVNDTNITSFEWTLGDGFGIANEDTVYHAFRFVPDNEQFEVVLTYPAIGCDSDGDGQDDKYNTIEYINIFPVESRFSTLDALTAMPDTNACLPFNFMFVNQSLGNNNYHWLIDGQSVGNSSDLNHQFENISELSDTVNVELVLVSQEGCKDTSNQLVILNRTPSVSLSEEQFICLNDSVELNSEGGSSVYWISKEIINNPASYNIVVRSDSTNFFTATVYETNGCSNSDSVLVKVQQIPKLYSSMLDTLVVIGTEFNILINSDQSNLTYQWTPSEGLSCSDCPNPHVLATEATEYKVVIRDSANCHEVFQTIFVDVFKDYTIDVPNTFTPNGDGYNDVVFVRGWGLKELIEFRIYNRWGEEVFFSDDFKVGWDGLKNGVRQNIDSYGYFARARTYNDQILEKKGTITLLR
ncbi:MAG: PKD domain-containing protein [Bacteroidales bacterium]|nr:PKD domain-containing protein [Bacteroidales bacterium]